MTHNPLVSIVMPSLNQGSFIRASIRSVLDQDYTNIELIIQDGGSNDETLSIMEDEARRDGRIRWTSSVDNGPANAISQALTKVRGEIIGWLNSDDLYVPGALETIVQGLQSHPDWIMCYGHGDHIDETGETISRYPTLKPNAGLEGFQGGCYICQPTVFFKTPLLAMLGGLDEELKTAFDYDLWLRAFRAFPERIGFLDRVLAKSRLHETCITQRLRQTVALEGLRLGRRHLGGGQLHWATTYLEELRAREQNNEKFKEQAISFLLSSQTFLSDTDFNQLKQSLASVLQAV